MKLSLKQKALLQTLKLMGSALLGSLAVSLMFAYFSIQTISIMIGVAVFGYLCYIVYTINLSQLEIKEQLNQSAKI